MFEPASKPTELAQVALFRDLSELDLQGIYSAGKISEIDAGDKVCLQGQQATAFRWFVRGRAKLTQVTEDGHQILGRFLGPGDCCGIIAAHNEAEYQATVEAVESCTVMTWDHDTLVSLLRQHPQFALNALEVLAERCQSWQQRYREATTRQVEQRIALTLLRLAGQAGKRVEAGVLIDVPLSREDLAEMTGTTLFTVSRILRRWEQREYVQLGRRRVIVRNSHSLVAISEGRRSSRRQGGSAGS